MFARRDSMEDNFDTDGKIEQFVMQVPAISSKIEGQMVKDIFDSKPEIEGVVVLDNSKPVGLIMRTAFYQKIGTLYGHSLYMKRPADILMETAMMSVDVNDNISKIGIQAMNRDQRKLYDYIIVYKNKSYLGVISIRLFLVELSKRNEAQINVLKYQQKELLSAHEQEVMLRKDLEYKSASVRNLLDHADQGFLSFESDLIVKNELSYKCLEIFDKNIGGENYIDLISAYFELVKASVFNAVLSSYFENNSPVTDNVYLMILPTECIIMNKNIRFEYKRIETNGKKAVMVILNDITEKVNMEKSIEEDRNKQRLLIKAFSYQAQIKQMMDEFNEMFSGGYRNFFNGQSTFRESLNELFRSVHTYKGDFAQYGFITASQQIHVFEDELLKIVNQPCGAGMPDIERVMSGMDPKGILESDLNVITEILGETYFDKSEIISIPKTKIEEIENKIRSGSVAPDKNSMISLIKSLQLKNVKLYINQYQDYLKYLSERLLKNMPVYIVEGDDIEVDGDAYGKFFKALVHIFRNLMDHAIETDEERLECGKAERGLVECKISRVDDRWFSISISDDGRGIDLKKLKNKALENKIYSPEELNSMPENEIVNLIFSDHLSTKDTSDALSGRGMGMAAFREACLKLGGKVKVSTKEGQGTTFMITLPYSNLLQECK